MLYALIYKNPGDVEKVEADNVKEALANKTIEGDPFMILALKKVTDKNEPYRVQMVKDDKCLILNKDAELVEATSISDAIDQFTDDSEGESTSVGGDPITPGEDNGSDEGESNPEEVVNPEDDQSNLDEGESNPEDTPEDGDTTPEE